MATSDILGLFMSPEQYQAQQMAQQQAAEQQRAFNFAQLSPRDQAVYGMFLGGQQLARGLGGLLGVQDPQLQRIRQRQEIMQSINPADMASLEEGILRASQAGDTELSLTLTDFMRKQASEMELARQRKAAADRERVQSLPAGVQEAELIGKLTEELQKTTDPNQRSIIQAKIKRLEKNLTKTDELEDLFVALSEATAEAQSRAAPSQAVGLDGRPLATQPTVNVDNDPRVKAIRARINTLTATPIDKQLPEVAKATALADLVSADRKSSEWQAEYATQLRRLTANKETDEKRSPEAQLLIDAGYIPGSPAFISELDKTIKAKRSGEKQFEKLVLRDEIVRLKELQVGLKKDSPEYKVYQEQIDFLEGGTGKGKVSAFAQLLLDRGIEPGSDQWNTSMDAYIKKESTRPETADQITSIGETVAGNKEGLPPGLKVYSNKTNKTQYVLRDGKEVPYYGSVEPPGKTTVEVKNIMPGQGKDGLTGIGKFRNEVGESIKLFRATVNAADAALQNIQDSIQSNNFTSFNAARVQLAKALGDSTLSRRDIEQAGGDPSLIGGFFDATSTLFTGTPSRDTQQKIKATLQAIRKVARKKAQDELAVQRQLGIRAGYTNEDINMAFNFPEITGSTAPANVAPKPKSKTVPFNALPK